MGGKRPGAGRPVGSKSKLTLEREARVIAATGVKPGQKLGVDIMSEAANYFFGLAAKYQPTGKEPNEQKFNEYLKTAADIANKVAPYQSQRLSSVEIRRTVDLTKLNVDELRELERLVTLAAISSGDTAGAAETKH